MKGRWNNGSKSSSPVQHLLTRPRKRKFRHEWIGSLQNTAIGSLNRAFIVKQNVPSWSHVGTVYQRPHRIAAITAGLDEGIFCNCFAYQTPIDQIMVVITTPAIKPARDDASRRPILKRNVRGSCETKSSVTGFMQ